MKIAIVGFGAAAIGYFERMKDTEHELHVFEKSADIYSTSISGIRADGKLFVSAEMGGDIEIPMDLQKQFVDFYINHSSGQVETGASFKNPQYYKRFYESGFLPITADFYHIGTDQLKQVLFNIFEDYKSRKNIRFYFENEVKVIDFQGESVILDNEHTFDKVVVAAGRSGHVLVKDIITKFH